MAEIAELWEALDARQRRLVEEWVKLDLHPLKQSEAFRAAGLDAAHSNPASARVQAARMFAAVSVKAVVAALIDSALPSPEQILHRRKQIAFSDIGQLMTDSGAISLAVARAAGLTHLIKSVHIRHNKEGKEELKVELHDPQPSLRALEMAAGLDRQQVTVEAGDRLAGLLAGLAAPWAGSGEQESG